MIARRLIATMRVWVAIAALTLLGGSPAADCPGGLTPPRAWDAACFPLGGRPVQARILPAQRVPAPWYRPVGAPQPWGAWSATTAASEAASKIDLSGNGNSLGEVGGGTGWTSAGWTTDGVGALSFGAAMGASDTLCVKLSGCSTSGTSFAFGAYQNNPIRRAHWTLAAGGRRYAGWKDTAQDLGAAISGGVMCAVGGQAYLNGQAVGTVPTTGSLPSLHVWIGGFNSSTPAYSAGCVITSGVRWTSTRTAAEMAALAAAMP